MKAYYIRTFATEDEPEMVCSYGYNQYKEVIASMKKSGKKEGIDFTTWSESISFESGIE